MEHVEVLRNMRHGWAAGQIGEAEGAALDAAIASLSAPQSAAEAQPCGCGEATCTVPWEPGCGLGKSEQHAEAQEQGGGERVMHYRKEMVARCRDYAAGMADIGADPVDLEAALAPLLDTAPPSAPVGVEAALRDALQGLIDFIEIDNLPMDADAMFIAKRALAQQPAAVDAPNVWRAAFVAERAARYREGGMAIEQARIHAETDATLMEQAASQQQGGEK